MFDTSQLLAASGSAGFYDHPIDQSLRFNDDDSAYLSRTPSSSGNLNTWTWSGWVKRGESGNSAYDMLFTAGSYQGAHIALGFKRDSNDLLQFYQYNSGFNFRLDTSAVYRDYSSWYHIVAVADTTNATAADRIRLYVNGERVTSFSSQTNPSQNLNTFWNSSSYAHNIGAADRTSGNDDFNGYMAEVHFIDGTALDASSFGEFKSGVWIPKAYSGSYGTNGFYLDFDGTYYNDKSGNGNNFTANNLAATDVVLDSPTNNFATLNPLVYSETANTFTEGNLKASSSGNNQQVASIAMQGKVYWEFLDLNGNGALYFSDDSEFTTEMYYNATNRASIYNDGTSGATGSLSWTVNSGSLFSWTTNDLIGVAYDADNHTLQLTKNGGSAVNLTINGLSGDTMLAVHGNRTSGSSVVIHANFGQDSSFAGNKVAQGNTDDNGYGDFYYAPPTGYLALCTANLEVPDAMNPALDASPQDYFNTVLYTGNASNRSITGVGFQPDLSVLKSRNNTHYHFYFDAVRGATKAVFSNGTFAEGTYTDSLTSFDSDGFSLGTKNDINNSGDTYVAWNWKAGGSGVSNTNGSITSTVSANTDAGFSIVSYTGTGSYGTIGHGLSQEPDWVIAKNRDNSWAWRVYVKDVTTTDAQVMTLNSTNALETLGATPWDVSEMSSSVIGIGNYGDVNNSGNDHIAYCFHSVEGFSKFGSYTGNGSTDGSFIYTGFTPAFIMIKNASLSGTSWEMFDTTRQTYNQNNLELLANNSGAEGTYTFGDILSNGFKHRGANNGVNNTGYTYIYMAFSSNPFKYSTAR